MRHLFVVNPVSGGGSHLSQTLEKINAIPIGGDTDKQIEITQYPKHATELIKKAAAQGGEWRVYACGGDGTLNEAVCAAAAAPNTAITHYPCGTGNDFIKCFGGADAFLDLTRLTHGCEKFMDCIDMGAGRYSVNICSAGLDADVSAGMPKFKWALKLGGKMPYNLSLLNSLLKGTHRPYKVVIDGRNYDGEYTILTACNGQVYGGGFKACPDADPSDGIMEFLLVKQITLFELTRIIGTYAAGGYKQLGNYIRHVRGKSMTLEANREININSDGETYWEKKITFSLSDRKIRFILPEGVY